MRRTRPIGSHESRTIIRALTAASLPQTCRRGLFPAPSPVSTVPPSWSSGAICSAPRTYAKVSVCCVFFFVVGHGQRTTRTRAACRHSARGRAQSIPMSQYPTAVPPITTEKKKRRQCSRRNVFPGDVRSPPDRLLQPTEYGTSDVSLGRERGLAAAPGVSCSIPPCFLKAARGVTPILKGSAGPARMPPKLAEHRAKKRRRTSRVLRLLQNGRVVTGAR